jgi:hypothetical protein
LSTTTTTTTTPTTTTPVLARINPVRLWDDYWFAPAAATNLAVARIAFYGLLLYHFGPQPFAGWADVPDIFWKPQWPYEVFHIPVLSRGPMLGVEIAWKVGMALACVGALTRLSTIVAFVCGSYLLGLQHCFGNISGADAAVALVLGILAVSRCGDALSIDRLLRTRRGDPTAALAPPAESGEYTWPIKAVWLTISFVFFNSAVAKLRFSGWAWALSDNFSILLVQRFYGADPKSEFGLHLAQWRGLCQALALGALILELTFPLVMVSRWARRLMVPAAYMMQYGNAVLLGVDFTQFTFAYVFFINWSWLARTLNGWMTRWRGATQPITPSTTATTATGARAVVSEPSA